MKQKKDKESNNSKLKLSNVFLAIGGFLILFLVLLFFLGVQPSALNVNVGGEKGITIGATGISDTTLIIVFSIAVVAFLTGLILKLKFER